MSIRLMAQIWDNGDPELHGSRLNVMLCLADHANDDGECWPSISRIAERTRLHKTGVIAHLKALSDEPDGLGYIKISRTAGRRNRYRVLPARPQTGSASTTGSTHATGSASTTSVVVPALPVPVVPALPESSVNITEPSKKKKKAPTPPDENSDAIVSQFIANLHQELKENHAWFGGGSDFAWNNDAKRNIVSNISVLTSDRIHYAIDQYYEIYGDRFNPLAKLNWLIAVCKNYAPGEQNGRYPKQRQNGRKRPGEDNEGLRTAELLATPRPPDPDIRFDWTPDMFAVSRPAMD